MVRDSEAIIGPHFHACYAASRISSNLNGKTSKFGWLQAPATTKSSLSITSANPATIRIDRVACFKGRPAVLRMNPLSSSRCQRFRNEGQTGNTFCQTFGWMSANFIDDSFVPESWRRMPVTTLFVLRVPARRRHGLRRVSCTAHLVVCEHRKKERL